jgi:DNA-binding NarL/FixJ family response regulator
VRILIADDHSVVRKGVCSILESRSEHFEVCGEACNGEEAIQKAMQLKPHLIILDVTMPVLDGFKAAKKISAELPEIPILMLSMHTGDEMVRISRSVGAKGFVTKLEIDGVLLKAARALLAGNTFFPGEEYAATASG